MFNIGGIGLTSGFGEYLMFRHTHIISCNIIIIIYILWSKKIAGFVLHSGFVLDLLVVDQIWRSQAVI